MDLITALMLLGAGFFGGMLSTVVGGAALLTFPALLAVGLPPANAIASNLTALVPANFLAAVDDRTVLPPFDARFIGTILASVAAAGVGAVLLLATPERLFTVLVPLLLGFATLLFGYGGKISDWLRARVIARGGSEADAGRTKLGFLLPVSFYGGYFGAGVGVLLIAVLSLGTRGDYRSANATKNLVTSLNSLAAAIYFSVAGAVVWKFTLVMLAGTLSGGWIGARIARIAPREVMRYLVIAIGLLLTATTAMRYWF